MRQILYVSSSFPAGKKIEIEPIFRQSRHNNALEGVTGLLYTDGMRFLQVLEGPEDAVETTFQRIKGDPRHYAIVKLGDRSIEAREFGDWSMAERGVGQQADQFDERMRDKLASASPAVRGTFLGLISVRKAA